MRTGFVYVFLCLLIPTLIWRNLEGVTTFRSIDSASRLFLQELQGGSTLASACAALLQIIPAEKIAETTRNSLDLWCKRGVLSALKLSAPASP